MIPTQKSWQLRKWDKARGRSEQKHWENTALEGLVPTHPEESSIVPEVQSKYPLGILKSAIPTSCSLSMFIWLKFNLSSLNSKPINKHFSFFVFYDAAVYLGLLHPVMKMAWCTVAISTHPSAGLHQPGFTPRVLCGPAVSVSISQIIASSATCLLEWIVTAVQASCLMVT